MSPRKMEIIMQSNTSWKWLPVTLAYFIDYSESQVLNPWGERMTQGMDSRSQGSLGATFVSICYDASVFLSI